MRHFAVLWVEAVTLAILSPVTSFPTQPSFKGKLSDESQGPLCGYPCHHQTKEKGKKARGSMYKVKAFLLVEEGEN